MSTFVDSHAHLAMLEHSPLEEILTRAKDAGITKMITVSTDEGSWESNQNLAMNHENLYFTLGLHPHDATHWAECAHKIEPLYRGLTNPKKCVAIGEMGLDFHYDFAPREIQIDVFESQLELAKLLNLPVVIHCRDAFEALFESVTRVGLSSWGGVLHCFTGTKEEALKAIDFGFKISFSGILTFKKAEPLREAAKVIPLSHLLLETDCPFLAPLPFRGKPNEPSYLPYTAATLAQLKGVSLAEIAERTSNNTIELFQLR